MRDLARQVAEIAASDENERIIRRWRDVNALRKPDRAPVYCRPVGVWAEILLDEDLRCSDPWLRSVERQLRCALIKRDIGDDDPVNPWFTIFAAYHCDPVSIWGVEIGKHQPDSAGGAWSYDPPLKGYSDLAKLRMPVYSLNAQANDDRLSRAHELLGDILPPRIYVSAPLHATLCVYAAELRGLSELMMDLAVDPEFVHGLMGYLRNAVLGAIDQVEATGMLSPNNTGSLYCSDPVGPDPGDGPITTANLWCDANSQEFDPVSPAMWEEFLLAYQMPILERFGLSAYGCCENLTHKIDGVLGIPNLRIFVCSAWTDLDRVVEKAGPRCAIMWRQKASDVVFSDDTDGIKRHLEEGARRLHGCRYQIVLRELQTLAGHPTRLHEWTRLAIEAAERHA